MQRQSEIHRNREKAKVKRKQEWETCTTHKGEGRQRMRATPVCLQQYAASNVQRSSAPPKRIGNVNFDVAPASCLLLALPRQNHKKIRKTRVVSRKVLIETPLELTLAVPNPSPTRVTPPPRSSPLLLYFAKTLLSASVQCVTCGVCFVCVCVRRVSQRQHANFFVYFLVLSTCPGVVQPKPSCNREGTRRKP